MCSKAQIFNPQILPHVSWSLKRPEVEEPRQHCIHTRSSEAPKLSWNQIIMFKNIFIYVLLLYILGEKLPELIN